MDAKEYLKSKGVFGLDTKKRYNEVIEWMEEYGKERVKNCSITAVSGQLPTNEEIDLIIEQDLPFSEEYQKYSEKEKILMLAATKAGAKWFRSSLIEDNFR
ncbi:MAG: hypothetical protein WC707_06745 [Candidatus Babeliaceae bacterium]|jgi:hypothetical protein